MISYRLIRLCRKGCSLKKRAALQRAKAAALFMHLYA